MTRKTEAIDWSAPIEAYHPDGRVVEVHLAAHVPENPDRHGDYYTVPDLDGRAGIWRPDGSAWRACSEWHIRNRKPAQQWGDPIEVNGERPVWLGDDDLLQFQTPANYDGEWFSDEGVCGGRKWSSGSWSSVQRIRLAADHWAYEALSRGMVPWAGGDEAPDDWDGGDVLLKNGEARGFQFTWRRNGTPNCVIGYKRRETVQFDGCTTREQAERLALDPELVDRMAWVIRRLSVGANVTDDDITTAICDIAAELPPEPVDPVVARAREIVAEALERQGGETNARPFRAGDRDDSPAMQAVIRALREGMGE